jgi:hypothetical protein
MKREVQGTHLGSIVNETIRPDEIKVVLEFFLGFVLLLLDLPTHCLEVHRIRYDFVAGMSIRVLACGDEHVLS